MIKAVLFDLDGTLFDRDATVEGILAWQVRTFSSVIQPDQADRFCERVTTLDEHGHRNKREVYSVVGAEFGLGPAVIEQLVASFWTEYPRHCRLGAGVADALAELRLRGILRGIVTNGTAAIQNAAIDALGIRDAMDIVLISETAGVRKPSPAIFHLAAAKIGVAPGDCCFVGDHPDVDIAGAKAAGLRGIWLRNPNWFPVGRVPTIESIPEILALLDRER